MRHSNGSAEPQLAAAKDRCSGGDGAQGDASVALSVGLWSTCATHGAVISIQARASRDSQRVVRESNGEARREVALRIAASTTTFGSGYDRESAFLLNQEGRHDLSRI
jgi:hypothetical protein